MPQTIFSKKELVKGPAPRKSSSCLTAAGLPRLVSRPAALPLPWRRQRQLQQGLPALGAPDGHRVHGPQLLRVAVLRLAAFVGARKAPTSSTVKSCCAGTCRRCLGGP